MEKLLAEALEPSCAVYLCDVSSAGHDGNRVVDDADPRGELA